MVPVYIKKDRLIIADMQISNTKDYTRMASGVLLTRCLRKYKGDRIL